MEAKLFHYVIRIPKEHSAFTYFQLEANDGLAFYSTLPHTEGQTYRDIDLRGSIELDEELKRLIHYLGQKFSIEWRKPE